MEKTKRNNEGGGPPSVSHTFKPLEVTLEEVGGDQSKLLRKFIKKVRKSEILKPFYGKLMYYISKSQKRRQKKLKALFNQKKSTEKDNDV